MYAFAPRMTPSFTGSLFLKTRSSMVRPEGIEDRSAPRLTSLIISTLLTPRITSLGRSPPVEAGLLGRTCFTMTPDLFLSPSAPRSVSDSSEMLWPLAPSQPAGTEPFFSMTRFATVSRINSMGNRYALP